MSAAADPQALLLDWIQRHRSDGGREALDRHSPIIAWRVITSLQVPDLLMYIEQISGHEIDVAQLTPGVFRSVESICAHFFSDNGPAIDG